MIPLPALLTILVTSIVTALVVAALAVLALRTARNAPMILRLSIVALATALSIVTTTIAVAREMYISDHDLLVLCWVIGVSAVLSLGITGLIALSVARTGDRLRSIAREIGEGHVVTAGGEEGREFAELARELASTSERLAQAREEVALADEARRRLFSWIAHDLRTPLAALRAMAESLEDGVAEDPARYYRQIRGQTETLASMVDDLFELSKIQSGTLTLNRESLSLFDLVSDAVAELHPLAAARSVTLTESRTGDLTVWGDARELSRVIGNLLLNAIQHSPAGSEILISARETEEQTVALSVTDAGGGIPEHDLGRIFDPGWRGTAARTPSVDFGRSAGAGLGLAIVHGIVQAHAGVVRVRNVPGGCRFDVVLPRVAGV